MQALFQGQCLASCPSGYRVEGSGSFNLRYVPTIAAATRPSALVCVGRTTVVAGRNPSAADIAASGQPCNCGTTLPDCHECRLARVYNSEALLGVRCVRCKNANYLAPMLSPPSCVESCPSGTIADGQGAFGRSCVTMPIPINDMCTMQRRESNNEPCLCSPLQECAACELGTLPSGAVAGVACTICKGGWFLGPDGVCVAQCPANFVGTGSGTFNKRCVEAAATPTAAAATVECAGSTTVGGGEPCSCSGLSNCHTCEALPNRGGGVACQVCKNGMLLLNGACVAACPAGFEVQGEGLFGRSCAEAVEPGQPPVGMCEGNSDLEGEACSCSELGDCHACTLTLLNGERRAQTCSKCKNEAYLLAGECFPTCPSGTLAQGQGKFGRTCAPVPAASTTAPATVSTASEAPPTSPAVELCADPSDSSCSCNAIEDCFACSVDGNAAVTCLGCRNGAFLLEGTCVASCPPGFVGEGESELRRRCVPVP